MKIYGFILLSIVLSIGIDANTGQINTVYYISKQENFNTFFKKFKQNISTKNFKTLQSLMHFPFYTGKSSPENQNRETAKYPISSTEFSTYQTTIYHQDVIRLLPVTPMGNVSEINTNTDDPYYQHLRKTSDKGSKMYEVYLQYPEQNTQAESYFGFVFGKVNGKYRVLAYYAKWPVK
ncbi:hypothetical protein ACJVDH_18385 [Pedobacter sp. AW1-32]|uniref:hypothetical protein n=1 Tax=Pedobacter sp. AW1-32 TaxID=3383026 RepID=UPI003FED858F